MLWRNKCSEMGWLKHMIRPAYTKMRDSGGICQLGEALRKPGENSEIANCVCWMTRLRTGQPVCWSRHPQFLLVAPANLKPARAARKDGCLWAKPGPHKKLRQHAKVASGIKAGSEHHSPRSNPNRVQWPLPLPLLLFLSSQLSPLFLSSCLSPLSLPPLFPWSLSFPLPFCL